MADEATTTEGTEGATSEEPGTENQEDGQPAELGESGKKALEAERSARKAAEKQAKDFQGQLDELRRAQMDDQEKAIDEARSAARVETLAEVGTKLAAAEFRVATAGRLDNEEVNDLLGSEAFNLAAFLTDSGDVDSEAIRSFVDKFVPERTDGTTPDLPDFGQGARGSQSHIELDPRKLASQVKSGW